MKIIINENQEQLLHNIIVNEEATYLGDKEDVIVNWLTSNFKAMDIYKKDDFGLPKKTYGVCVLNQDKQITDDIISMEDIFYRLQSRFKKILSNKNERDALIKSALNRWFKNG